jgi:CheY-like chemotaxis protein
MSADQKRRQTILVIDDEHLVLDVISNILTEEGFEVLKAATSEEALQKAAPGEHKIDLVLADIVMPGMSGGELVKMIQSLQPEIRVLYMSGFTKYTILDHGNLESVGSFIWKPFAPADLLAKIRELLEVPS